MAKNSRQKFRPNFARQMLYAGIALASIFGGYILVMQFGSNPSAPDIQATSDQSSDPQAPKPWYQNQAPPPSLITTPDAPLFPEPEAEPVVAIKEVARAKTTRAYEEALPKEIYEPPAPAVVEQAPEKIETPEIAPENQPWRQYAVAVPPQGDGPLIAIVIDDMGVDKIRSARAINLKAPLTLSFLTYADDLAEQTRRARRQGHELMLHVSMEPASSTVDPGPNALLTNLDDAELRRRLDWGFDRFTGYVGINNHMGSKFTADSHAMQLVIEAVKRRGLLFLDSRTSGRTVGAKLARQMGVPSVERNIFLDHVNSLGEVNARLAEVEKFARRNGFAVAIGHPRQATIEALEIWLEGIQAKGFTLVPITAIVAKYGAS